MSKANSAELDRATLSAMSPDEFTLVIRSTDAAAHMEIDVQLQRHQYSRRKSWPVSLIGGFEVEPHAITRLLPTSRN